MTAPTAPADNDLDLAVAVTACNNMRTIERVLESARPLARRIVVVDSGSTDGTVEACRNLGAEVIYQQWLGHTAQKQFAIDLCRMHAWVLLLDSDEILEPDLRASIRTAIETDDGSIDGWHINRKTWFLGGWLHYTYQPEWRLRLVRGGRAVVRGPDPHDRLEVEGRTGRLRGDIRHESSAGVEDLARKQIFHARVTAESARRGGGVLDLVVRPPAALIKQLILRRGFMDGRRGLILAALSANYTMLKHVFIAARRLEERREAGSRA